MFSNRIKFLKTEDIEDLAKKIQTNLLCWYDKSHRDLPWRKKEKTENFPYEVWTSEIMLQQTKGILSI